MRERERERGIIKFCVCVAEILCVLDPGGPPASKVMNVKASLIFLLTFLQSGL